MHHYLRFRLYRLPRHPWSPQRYNLQGQKFVRRRYLRRRYLHLRLLHRHRKRLMWDCRYLRQNHSRQPFLPRRRHLIPRRRHRRRQLQK